MPPRLVDPLDVGALTDGLAQVLQDESLREQMRDRGIAQSARFSWAHAAEETLAVYRRVMGK